MCQIDVDFKMYICACSSALSSYLSDEEDTPIADYKIESLEELSYVYFHWLQMQKQTTF